MIYAITLIVIAATFLVTIAVARLVQLALRWLDKREKEEEMATLSTTSCARCGLPWALCQCASPMLNQNVSLGQTTLVGNGIPGQLGYITAPRLILGAGTSGITYVPDVRNKPNVKAEDRAEPVYGWRCYALTTGGILWGVREPWPERRKTATCTENAAAARQMQIAHLLQDDVAYRFWLERQGLANSDAERCRLHLEKGECSCGIYLRAKPELWETPSPVMAKALAYGVVACDEDGNARASDVQIESLYVLRLLESSPLYEYIDWERMGNVLRGRYDVPVTVIDSVAELTEVTA